MKGIGFLFDLDGVIIDTEAEYTKIWQKINTEYPTGILEFENKIKGTTLENILNQYYNSDIIKKAVADRLHDLESQMQYRYLPGSKEFLNEVKKQGIPSVLVTSSDDTKMKRLYEQMPELSEYFDFIITAENVMESKPSPQGYLLGAKKLNLGPKNCVVFEDALQGVKAGKNAGCYVVGIAGTLPEKTLAPFSDKIVTSLNDIDIESLIELIEKR